MKYKQTLQSWFENMDFKLPCKFATVVLMGFVLYLVMLRSQPRRSSQPFVKNTTSLTDSLKGKNSNPESKQLVNTEDIENPVDIDEFLEERNKTIFEELNRRNVDLRSAKQLIPANGGKPKRLIVVATWRTGSTFVSELIASALHNVHYFIYEPLLPSFKIHVADKNDEEFEAINTLKKVMSCQYDQLEGERNFFLNVVFNRNPGLFQAMWKKSTRKKKVKKIAKLIKTVDMKSLNESLQIPEAEMNQATTLAQKYCKLHPYQVVKTLRIRLKSIEKLIADPSFDSQFLFLARDPRATLHSRSKLPWCTKSFNCYSPKRICENLVDDYDALVDLRHKYPDRVKAVRFEDLAMHPEAIGERILNFFGLKATPYFQKYILYHTSSENDDSGAPDSTFRDSVKVISGWTKPRITSFRLSRVEQICEGAMQKWGYLPKNEVDKNELPINEFWADDNQMISV